MAVRLVTRRVCSGAWLCRYGVGVPGASGVMGVGSAVFLRTVGRLVRVMPWCVSLGGTAFGWIQHSVLEVLSCRPSGVTCF